MDDRPDRGTATSIAKEQSPVSEAIDRNSELLMAVEKQVEVLASRLEHVSSSEPTPPSDDKAIAGRGNSSLASRIHSQGSQLAAISDRLSYVTRMLEI
jgi:hypothetical protein